MTNKYQEPAKPLNPEQTRAWLSTYARHSRIYAWGFFTVVSALIFGLIWWELGEINEDLIYSFAFSILIFFLLAYGSRKKTTQTWTGNIEKMFMKKIKNRGADGSRYITYSPIAQVRTQQGKKQTIRLTQKLYQYFSLGDEIFTISGLDWLEKTTLDHGERVCLACGNPYQQHSGQCPRCGAPEPDHATLVQWAKK